MRQHRPRPSRGDGALRRRGVPVSVTAPEGFVASGLACGIKASGAPDLALVASTSGPVPAAGVFTANLAAAAPVQVSRDHLAATAGRAAAVVLSSGNANAATGAPGKADARAHVHAGGRRARRARRPRSSCARPGSSGSRCPWRPSRRGSPRWSRRAPGARRGAAGRRRHHDHRHDLQGGDGAGAGVHRGRPWPRGRPCSLPTWRRCWPCSRPTPGVIRRTSPSRLRGAVEAHVQPDDRGRVHVDQRHRAGPGQRGEPAAPVTVGALGDALAEACGELAGHDGGRRRGGHQGGARDRDGARRPTTRRIAPPARWPSPRWSSARSTARTPTGAGS